jgi:hypothetical protein
LEFAKGLQDKEVASNLYRSYWTVKTQKKAIYKKLGITKDVELLWWLVCKRLGIEFDLSRIRRIGIEVLQDADV